MTITPNSGEYKVRINLEDVYVAPVTADSADAYTAGTPEKIAPVGSLTIERAFSTEPVYADGHMVEQLRSEGPTKLTFDFQALPAERQAQLLGKQFDSTTGRVYNRMGNAEPPQFAVGFRSEKSNGKYRYYWFLKGTFEMPKEEMASKTDKYNPKMTQIIFNAVFPEFKHTYDTALTDHVDYVWGDEDSDNFSGTSWFSQVQVPGVAAVSALALSSSDPVDGASGVAVSKTITLTFNNALPADAITNVIVVKADGTHVICTNSLDAAKKVMTVNPDSDLSAASTYLVTYGLTDIYNQTLKGAINFATT